MGMLPELRDVAADPFFQNDPYWRVFLSVLPRSRWIPIRRWEPMDRAMRDALAEVAAGRLEPEQALEEPERGTKPLAPARAESLSRTRL